MLGGMRVCHSAINVVCERRGRTRRTRGRFVVRGIFQHRTEGASLIGARVRLLDISVGRCRIHCALVVGSIFQRAGIGALLSLHVIVVVGELQHVLAVPARYSFHGAHLVVRVFVSRIHAGSTTIGCQTLDGDQSGGGRNARLRVRSFNDCRVARNGQPCVKTLCARLNGRERFLLPDATGLIPPPGRK